MGHKSLLIITFMQVSVNGGYKLELFSTYLMEWMDRGLNIVLDGWRDSCYYQMIIVILIKHKAISSNLKKETSKLLLAQHHLTTFTFSEDSSEEAIENP